MEVVLKRLLDAELRAETLIEEAQRERDAILEKVHDEVADLETEFRESAQRARETELERAEQRATQTIEELGHREQEQQRWLYELAQDNEQSAIDAALALFIKGEG
jgi:hypothetical protein